MAAVALVTGGEGACPADTGCRSVAESLSACGGSYQGGCLIGAPAVVGRCFGWWWSGEAFCAGAGRRGGRRQAIAGCSIGLTDTD